MAKKIKKPVKVWYKSNCATCINVKGMLEDAGYEPTYFDYLNEEIKEDDLKFLIHTLGVKPEALIRKKESIYKEQYATKKMSASLWIKAMIKYPILIERPILITEEGAWIGRPLEAVVAFCKK